MPVSRSAARDDIPVSAAAALGLALGKPAGIMLASWLAVRSGLAPLPQRVSWRAAARVRVAGRDWIHDVDLHRDPGLRRHDAAGGSQGRSPGRVARRRRDGRVVDQTGALRIQRRKGPQTPSGRDVSTRGLICQEGSAPRASHDCPRAPLPRQTGGVHEDKSKRPFRKQKHRKPPADEELMSVGEAAASAAVQACAARTPSSVTAVDNARGPLAARWPVRRAAASGASASRCSGAVSSRRAASNARADAVDVVRVDDQRVGRAPEPRRQTRSAPARHARRLARTRTPCSPGSSRRAGCRRSRSPPRGRNARRSLARDVPRSADRTGSADAEPAVDRAPPSPRTRCRV